VDILRPIVSSFTWNAYLRRDGYDLRPLRSFLNDSQYYPLEKLHQLQLERLRSLIVFAARENDFYRERFRTIGFDPGDLRTLGDFSALPILTKDDIRGSLGQCLSRGFDRERTIAKRTGGSTGVPVRIRMDYRAMSWKKAATERHNRWAGLVPGPRLAALWGDTSAPLSWRERLRNNLTGRVTYLDTLEFDEKNIEHFLSAVRRGRPPILMGHAHSLYRLALYVRDVGLEDISFDGVISTAMGISAEERRTVEDVFRTRVYDRYGCEELSLIASQCEVSSGMHIFSEGVLVESIGQGEGRPGKLIVTDLLNHAMPLIRYEIGDYAILSNALCSCGRGLPLIAQVVGREADFLYRRDGVPVFGISILDTFAIHIPGIKQVQIRQDFLDRVDFTVVPDESFNDDSLRLLRVAVDEVFGVNMQHTVRLARSIAQTIGGKFRFSICNLTDDEIERGKVRGQYAR
jgi:phenylacetate-CoA ligase